jgi:hypothetical protein
MKNKQKEWHPATKTFKKKNKGPRVFMLLNFCGNQLGGSLAEV